MPPTTPTAPPTLVWFRRDLRDYDHRALSAALACGGPVYCIFVFDTDILDALPSRTDRRVAFIHGCVVELDAALRTRGGGLIVRHGRAVSLIPALARELEVTAVYANRDYEPAAKIRDNEVAAALTASGIAFHTFKDQCLFERNEVLTQAGGHFTVFTPYKNAWLKRLTSHDWLPATTLEGRLCVPKNETGLPTLSDIGFDTGNLAELGIHAGMAGARTRWQDFQVRMDRYHRLRDYPAARGVSYLSVDLRFGTLSLRELVAFAATTPGEGAKAWLNELIWRDFYFMVLDTHPQVVTQCFKVAFDALRWDDWPEGLHAWQQGRTGYPLVDAAMRQLLHSGWMHNRLRMVTASFLCKDLGIDWRLGEAWFAAQLNDFDLAANNGGWQWAASTGCDAQPWFRIFNPVTQSEKFDPEGRFIRRYVPELAKVPDKFIHAPWKMSAAQQTDCGVWIGRDYPAPIVDHTRARTNTLARYKQLE